MANSRKNFFSDFSVCSVKDIWNDLTGKTWNIGKLKRNAIKETSVGLLLLTIFEHCKISMAYWGEQVKLAHSGLAGQLPDGCPVPVPAPGANASARWNCLAVPCQCQVPGARCSARWEWPGQLPDGCPSQAASGGLSRLLEPPTHLPRWNCCSRPGTTHRQPLLVPNKTR